MSQAARTADFRVVVEKKLKKQGVRFADVCPVDTDSAARRIFSDYGAIFVSDSDDPLPPKCIFDDEAEVAAFQSSLKTETQNIGGTSVTLQKSAMDALSAARDAATKRGLSITPRGGQTASSRTFGQTLTLWNSRFLPGLDHWVKLAKITPKDAEAARRSSIPEQIKKVLEWEGDGLYFSKDLSKSILYSVAAPGASQHIFMLALDVEQYSDPSVRQILAAHGWFQTVKSDMPHFTYLGVKESELPLLGLKKTMVESQLFWIPNLGPRE
ncbi:MAG: hypothetical protein ACRD43_14070 [Pyrinomonadaceae bacterium]